MSNSVEPSTPSTSGSIGKKPSRLSMSSVSQQTPRVLSPTAGSSSDGGVKFPRIDECAHFHYETVECGRVEMALLDEAPDGARINGTFDFEKPDCVFWINVKCKGKEWVIRRLADQFKNLDELLHECVYDRRFTHLKNLNNIEDIEDDKALHDLLKRYVSRLSDLPENQMSCAPVLHWFDMDNKGTKLVAALRETADINIPAVAAAHTIRRYTAQSADELSLEVGDMVSIIDMSDANWWRGKCRLQVGSFPAQCVKRISDAKQADQVPSAVNLPSSPISSSPPNLNTSRTKPIVKKHGKFMEFLRSFLVTRPSKSRLKQTGILKERVFGCDLGEYLHNCESEVPVVVKDCTDFVENYGIVDGIYRISGVASHVQNLRHEYDCERRPNMNRDPSGTGEQSICDPHSVAGLCKLYFRELPNPLLTYQLYNRFAAAISTPEDERLLKIYDVIQQLPPPHYRTLKHLALHLQTMARHDDKTSMHCRNLAIVWAPNLLRSRDLEAGLAAFTEARVQSVVTEFLIVNADLLFSDQLQNIQLSRGQKPPRPKSLMVLSGPKLISLQEAQARSKAGGGFSIPSGENFANSVRRDEDDIPVRRSRKMSSPPGYPHPGTSSPSKPIAIIPLSSGGHSVGHKRRQSMDTKLGTRQQHNNFPSNPRHYSSQHSTGWRSKLGSFLKKNNAGQVQSEPIKTDSKGPLRRSQSDDSLLSSHSTRPDETEENADTKSSDGVHSLDPPTLRKGSSPRSPRPMGRIFSSQENLDAKGSEQVTTSTPDSVPTPSLETNPSSHNPFSGLDSDFPGVMGESGLGFNPLQYSPTFLSDSGIPELPQASDECHIPESNGYTTELPGHISEHEDEDERPRKSIGSLDDIKPVKQPDQSNSKKNPQNHNPGEDHMAELNTLYINSKIEDILNANVKIKEINPPDNLDSSEDVFQPAPAPSKIEVKRDKFQAVVDVLATYSKNRSNDTGGNVILRQKSDDNVDETPKSRNSYYWKTEEVDSLSEIDKLNLDDDKDVENTTVPKRTQKQPTVLDLPQTGSYSVQYACSNQHNSNGTTQQSITATFVQDRPLDPKIRRPHSIRRCMDIPPTEVTRTTSRLLQSGQSSKQHHRSVHDITRRHKAYAAWVTQHQKDDKSPRLHHRSLSTGDELDLESPRPVPAPRSSYVKPVPVPRRSHGYLDKVKYAKKFNETPKTTYDHTVSAPSTPVDSQHHITNILPNVKSTSYQHVSGFKELPQAHSFINPICLTKHNEPVTKPTGDNILSSTRSPLLRKQASAPGIVSPSDNVCASTVLSWV